MTQLIRGMALVTLEFTKLTNMDLPNAISYARPNTQWTLNGNTLDDLTWIGPGEPPTMEELEAAWAQLKARKIWPDKSRFWNEFTADEKSAILTSEHGGIKVLHSDLTMWPGEVWSDDSRIQQGLSGLVAVKILTESRKTQILTKIK
jgi:hypothetical protein